MVWRHPVWLWAEWLPGFVFLCWVLAAWLENRRLKQLGDPVVLGVSFAWSRRLVALALLTLGLMLAGAVLAVPVMRGEDGVPTDPKFMLLIDVPSFDAAPGRLWPVLEDTINSIVDHTPGVRFEVLITGLPPEVLVPPTLDNRGLMILVSRLPFHLQQPSRAGIAETLARLTEIPAEGIANSRLLVVTAIPVEDIMRIQSLLRGNSPDTTWVNISSEVGPTRYGRQGASGKWTWSSDVTGLDAILAGHLPARAHNSSINLVQWSALLALLLLSADSVLGLASKSNY